MVGFVTVRRNGVSLCQILTALDKINPNDSRQSFINGAQITHDKIELELVL